MNETIERITRANPVPEVALLDDQIVDSAALFSSIVSRRQAVTSTHTGDRKAHPLVREPRQQRPAFVAASAAVVLVVAIGATTLMLAGGGGTSPADPSGPAATDPAPVTTEALPPSTSPRTPTVMNALDPSLITWSRIDPPGVGAPYLYLDGVIAGGPGLIAVGSGSDGEMIWTSTTGTDWVPAEVGSDGWAFDVTAGGPGYVAVGSSVWISTDGSVWQALPVDPIAGEARAITEGGPGLVAVGSFVDGTAGVWSSGDGITWVRIPTIGQAEMHDVIAGGPGLIAVGSFRGAPAIWTSPDGVRWSRVLHDPDVFGRGVDVEGEILSIAPGGPGYVAVSAMGDTGLGVWTSIDGTSWSPVQLDPAVFDGDEEMRAIVAIATGLVAAGFEGDDAAAWFSADGVTWTPFEHGGLFGGEGFQGISDIALLGDGLAAVGWSYPDRSDRIDPDAMGSGVVWIAEPAAAMGDR